MTDRLQLRTLETRLRQALTLSLEEDLVVGDTLVLCLDDTTDELVNCVLEEVEEWLNTTTPTEEE